MHKLIFRGELVSGYVKADVISKLAALLKQPPERIETLFLGNQEKIIKRVDAQAKAQQWVAAFARAGAVLAVADETATITADSIPHPVQPASTVNEHLPAQFPANASTKKSPLFKRLVVGILGSLLLIAGLAFFFQQHLNRLVFSAVNQDEKNIIASLASNQLLAIARVDIELMKTLERTFGESDQLQNLPGSDADIWSGLARAGIDVQRQINQLYAAVYVADEPELVIIARGNLDEKAVERWIGDTYGIDKQDEAGIWFAPMNQAKCAKGEQLLAQISAGQVLIGSPEAVKRVSLRLQQQAVADVDISEWQHSLAGQLVSVAGFSPARWQSDPSDMAQYMLGKLTAKMKPVDAIYVGVEPDLIAQALTMNVSLVSNDRTFIGETEQSLQKSLTESKQKIAQDWPEVKAIYERIRVSQQDNKLLASVRFDRDFKDELSAWFGSMFSFSRVADSSVVPQEIIEEQPAFFAPASVAQLKPFTPQDDFMDGSLQTFTGPFGVGIESVAIEKEQLQFRLGVKAYDLPNMGEENSGVLLSVTDVLDAEGNSLLSTPACGSDEQRAPTAINNSYGTSRFENNNLVAGRALSGNKDILMAKGVTFLQVARIKGHIDYGLPTAVTTTLVSAPFAGKVVDVNGVRVRFMSAGASSLSIEYSGDTQKLLHIHALNAAGKPLSDSSSMRSSVFFGSGKKSSLDFNGTIAQVELIVAETVDKQRYEFELTQVAPPSKDFFSQKPFPEQLTSHDFVQLSKAAAPVITEYPYQQPKMLQNIGPATLALNDMGVNKSFGFSASGSIYTNITLPLFNRIGIAQLQLDQLVNASGQEFTVRAVAPLSFDRVGGIVFNGVYEGDEKTPWLKSDFSLRLSEMKEEGIVSARGKLRFFLPKSLRTESVAVNLGELWSGVRSSLMLKKWESGRLIFVVEGALDEVVGLKAFNADGELISQPPTYSFSFGEPEIAVEISELPARLDVEIAKGGEQLEYPFELKIPQFFIVHSSGW
jgi:hypothetical protein